MSRPFKDWSIDRVEALNAKNRASHQPSVITPAQVRQAPLLAEMVERATPPDAPPKENEIQREIRDALRKHPAVQKVWRVNSGAHTAGSGDSTRFIRYHDVRGMSDLWVLLKPAYGPRMGFIEVKRPGEKLKEHQALFLDEMRSRGHISFMAQSAIEAWTMLDAQVRAVSA